MNNIDFATFLRSQAGRDDPIGDLGRDFIQGCRMKVHDPTLKGLSRHIRAHGCRGALDAFINAKREWRAGLATEQRLDQRYGGAT